jgi:predicted dehydrogenase
MMRAPLAADASSGEWTMTDITRRRFVKTVASTGAALTIVPRHVLGRGFQAPSDTVNIAAVGIGGRGGSDLAAVLTQNIVAICDVDDAQVESRFASYKRQVNPPTTNGQGRGGAGRGNRPQRALSAAQVAANQRRPVTDEAAGMRKFVDEQMPKVQKYRDYREMLEKQKDIDAIMIATPDHMHAAIASAAMDIGKHVYCEKPLCWSVKEARHLAKKAKDNPKLVTQMGNQGHSRDEARTSYEYITSGVIGDIREVHVWTNRPLGFWPQGIPAPAPMPAEAADRPLRWNKEDIDLRLAAALASGSYPVPPTLAWDLFLGSGPVVDYHPIYHPFNWRGWVNWGQGALGDMGAHLIDHPFWSLKLGMPTSIETVSTPFNGATYPAATMTHYQFAARGNMPPVRLTWYDGGFSPARPEEIGDEKLNGEGGVIYVGSKGKMMQETYGLNPRLLGALKDTPAPKQKLPRIAHEEHQMNWIEAIKGKAEVSTPFEYATQLTEVMLLGIVSLRAKNKLVYDGANMRITNIASANDFLGRDPRPGFELK